MTDLAWVLLTITASLCFFRLFKGRQENVDRSPEIKVSRLAMISVALAALIQATLTPTSTTQVTLIYLFNNLALYAAVPLLGSVLLVRTHARSFSLSTWGRYLLALMALFELCRRLEVADQLLYLWEGILVLTLLWCVFKVHPKQRRALIMSFTTGVAVLVSWHTPVILPVVVFLSCLALWFFTSTIQAENEQE